jgi:hypothetical protein
VIGFAGFFCGISRLRRIAVRRHDSAAQCPGGSEVVVGRLPGRGSNGKENNPGTQE